MGITRKSYIRINTIHFPVLALGPGIRVGLWTQGCSIKCKGCMSTHTWSYDGGYNISIEELAGKIFSYPTTKLTISGGEPLDQYESIILFLSLIRNKFNDILLYTGYEYHQVKEKFSKILDFVDVLVTGPFLEHFNSYSRLKGSSNQEVIFLKDPLKKVYNDFEQKKVIIQKVIKDDFDFYIGIPIRDGYERKDLS